MTRENLDRLRRKVREFKKAVERDNMLQLAREESRRHRNVLAGELADELHDADVPDGEGFEHEGLVVWRERAGRLTLNHIFLAFYRRA